MATRVGRRIEWLVLLPLITCCLAATKIDIYFATSAFYDFGALLCAALPYILCLKLRGSLKHYVVTTMFLVGVIALSLIYGLVFFSHQGASPIVSALTLRSWLYIMIAPAVWIMLNRGYSPSDVLSIFKWTSAMCLPVILYTLYTVDLLAMKKGVTSGVAENLVRFDDARGFRLDVPHFFLMLSLISATFSVLFQRRFRIYNVLLLAVGGWAIYLSYSRVVLAAIPIALFLFGTILVFRMRVVRYVVAPVVVATYVACTPLILSFSLAGHDTDRSAITRNVSLERANDVIGSYPILGYGQAITSQLSYQNIFGADFFPSDLGTTGILFRFGYVGLAIYIVIAAAAVSGSWYAWGYAARLEGDYSMAALPIVVFMMAIVSFSWPAFLSLELPIAAFAIGCGMGLFGIKTPASRRKEETGIATGE